MELKIKLITGFRKEQKYTIDAEEAHKAYYLFLNPTQRGVFNNGVALQGSMIQGIEPDYHATMGWNETHVLDGDDWNEINSNGVAKKIQHTLSKGKTIASTLMLENPSVASTPISRLEDVNNVVNDQVLKLAESFKLK